MPIRMQRFRKEFLERKVRTMIEEKALVAVAYVGNMNHSDKTMVRQELAKAEATISFTKSTLQRMALDSMGHASLVPLLRGETSIIAGPAEVSTAIALQAISKQLPDFTVLGASLHQRRLLQARFEDLYPPATPATPSHPQPHPANLAEAHPNNTCLTLFTDRAWLRSSMTSADSPRSLLLRWCTQIC